MRPLATALPMALVLITAWPRAGSPSRAAQPAGTAQAATSVVHHYAIDGGVRPLLFFWISRRNIGDATITWRHDSGTTEYSLLIGTDPSRAPRHLNRWGYADERLRGATATILGVMTRSDEQSLEQAEADVKSAASQPQAFRVIRESVNGPLARASAMTLGTRQHYTFEQLQAVLAKVPPASAFDHTRRVTLPPGTAPGFLAAVARLIEETLSSASTSGDPAPVRYVYNGRLYRLGASDMARKQELTAGGRQYRHLLDTTFDIHNIATGDDTDFEMTYGTEGELRGIPVTIEYQPRWWLRLKLRLTDASPS